MNAAHSYNEPGHEKSIVGTAYNAIDCRRAISMKRSASVTLTLVVTLTVANAQQGSDPCDAATFNAKVCKVAVRSGSYCSQGVRVITAYPESYPYYYDLYRSYASQGGVVDVSSAETCPRSSTVIRGGFGMIGAHHGGGSKAGC